MGGIANIHNYESVVMTTIVKIDNSAKEWILSMKLIRKCLYTICHIC